VDITAISNHEIQLWQVSLLVTPAEEQRYALLLSADETKRAQRFHFARHARRYTVARAVLRMILSRYLNIAPNLIEFSYSEHGKPAVAATALQFNVSHSDEMAVYAFTRVADIGVDIEKVEPHFKDDLAQRFFSPGEYDALAALTGDAQVHAFYRVWSRKEALLKALGMGLHLPLASFSVSLAEQELLKFHSETPWHIQSFIVGPDYEAAFATSQTVAKISRWEYQHSGNIESIYK
jgi:4'-phosphopantetheinyl transferase